MSEKTPEDKKLQLKIAERIESLRLKTGMTQSEFAQKHDIERQFISRWESTKNERGVTIYTIKKFCAMIGIGLKDFFDTKEFDDI